MASHAAVLIRQQILKRRDQLGGKRKVHSELHAGRHLASVNRMGDFIPLQFQQVNSFSHPFFMIIPAAFEWIQLFWFIILYYYFFTPLVA